MARTYALASIKGGVGKTTLTGNLGVALDKLGSATLLVDADMAMGSLTYLMGVGTQETALQDLLAGEGRVKDALYGITSGLDILPTGGDIRGYLAAEPERLSGLLDRLGADYDYILVDTPPGLSKYNLEPYKTADDVLMVVAPNPPAVSAGAKLEGIAEAIGVDIAGAIVNRVEQKSFLDKILRRSPVSLGPVRRGIDTKIRATIPEDEEVLKATRAGKPVVVQSSDSPASEAILKLADALPS